MDLTYIIIAITVLVTMAAFERPMIFEKLLLSPYMIINQKQWYRVITHGFIHANWMHLLINMLVFYSFGQALNYYLSYYFNHTALHFLVIYFGGMIFATLSTIIKYRDNFAYRSVGASGAVSAVMFACIFFNPWSELLFFGILPIPGIVFGVLYLAYCSYMSKKSNDNINHDAHMYGAIFGFLYPVLVQPKLLMMFLEMLKQPHF